MVIADLKPGAKVFDSALRRVGTVIGLHRPANPSLDVEEAVVRVSENAIIWANISNLLVIKNTH